MKVKRIIAVIVLLLMGVVVAISPFGVLSTINKVISLRQSNVQVETARSDMTIAKNNLNLSMDKFRSTRSFEVDFSDIDGMLKVLANVSSVSVSSVEECDPDNYYTTTQVYTPGSGSQPEAIKLQLTVEDLKTGLDIIDRLGLPVVELNAVEPNMVTVTYLTGLGL